MSRIVSGKLRMDVQIVPLPAIIEAAIESVRPAAEARQIRLATTLDANCEPVRGDPNQLQQIVWNLLSNAVKFTPSGGQVSVELRRAGLAAQIIVRDTGQGIGAEFLPHVFERFRQADSSTTRRHSGLGLGLAIVRHLAESHGGSVGVASPGEDQGSTFTVSLPLAQANLAAGRRGPRGRNGQTASRPGSVGRDGAGSQRRTRGSSAGQTRARIPAGDGRNGRLRRRGVDGHPPAPADRAVERHWHAGCRWLPS